MKMLKKYSELVFLLAIPVLLYGDSRDTRQITIDIDYTLTACCQTAQNDAIGTFTMMQIIKQELSNSCVASPITKASVGTSGYTITVPGAYIFVDNIDFAPVGATNAITINADDVVLDLQGFTLAQANAIAGVNGIVVGNHSNSVIKNGAVNGMTSDGIQISAGASDVACSALQIRSCGMHGMYANGSSLLPIARVNLSGLELILNGTGVTERFVQEGTLSESFILTNSFAGVELINSFSTTIQNCTIQGTQSSVYDVYGISAVSGGNNSFMNNSISALSTLSTSSINKAVGIFIGATEANDVIEQNSIDGTLSTATSRSYGIQMDYTFTAVSPSGLPTIVSTNVVSTEWSPDGRYVATINSTAINIYEYRNNIFTLIASQTLPSPVSVSWSANGSYLVVGDNFSVVSVFTFDGTTLTAGASVTPGAGINQVACGPDGSSIAIGSVFNQLYVYRYSLATDSLVLVASTNISLLFGLSVNVSVLSVAWQKSLTDQDYYLACGLSTNANNIVGGVMLYDQSSLSLIGKFTGTGNGNSSSVTRDGKFVAIAQGSLVTIFDLLGNNFGSFNHGATLNSVAWSPDNNYLLIGGLASGGVTTRVLRFNQNSLSLVANYNNATQVNAVVWRPSGDLIAQGSNQIAASVGLTLLSGLRFPAGSIIRNNSIFATQGQPITAVLSTGRGLVASSAANLIMQNTAFDNDINYVFVTDIFRQYLANASPIPTLSSNLSFPPL